MSVIGSNILAGASGQGGGYNLTKSLRFRSSASAYLNRTPASAGNRKTWTWSSWVKRGTLGSSQNIFAGNGTTDTTFLDIRFTTSDTLQVGVYTNIVLLTTQVFRDPSAWYHIVWLFDTTQASASNRCRLFVNGTEITAFSTDSRSTYFAQNTDYGINNNTAHNICRNPSDNSKFFDGYLTEVNFIDGQALTPSSFGETSTSTGVWIPKKYTGTYGTNGFYLPFTDTTSTSTLGTDFSGNSNTWTVNNISLTSGSTYDSMTDVTTLTSATTANYCVLNPLSNPNAPIFTLSNGNLNYSCSASAGNGAKMAVISTMALHTGKVYWEILATNTNGGYGVSSELTVTNVYGLANANVYSSSQASTSGITYSGTTFTYTTNDTLGFAWDGTALTLGCYKNDALIGTFSGFSATTVYFPQMQPATASASTTFSANFGQQPFAYTPPTGFVALNTYNLPTPTIGATASTTANKYFDATTYAGNNTSGTNITNSGSMQPDFVWIKNRTGANNHILTDAVRGATKTLFSDSTSSELTIAGALTAFNSNGFQVGYDTSAIVNASSNNYVGWQWRANGTGVTNTAGSITSTVSANTTAGFSIVTWTGSGSTATIGHGLGVTPSMIIWMHRTNADAYSHGVYHVSLPSAAYAVQLNLTLGQSNDNNWWNSTAPTSSVFTVGGYNIADTMVAYCFAPVAGYSAFGSYTGNGSSDGVFVYTGFKPKFLLIKRSDSAADWYLYDSARGSYNENKSSLYPNSSDAEGSSLAGHDFLSNGFKVRTSINSQNTNGGTYIYMAFAETPFKYANAR